VSEPRPVPTRSWEDALRAVDKELSRLAQEVVIGDVRTVAPDTLVQADPLEEVDGPLPMALLSLAERVLTHLQEIETSLARRHADLAHELGYFARVAHDTFGNHSRGRLLDLST
jgi:hypothetical protein